MAFDKAETLSDEELAGAITDFKSGKRKFTMRDDEGRLYPWARIIVAVFERAQENRRKQAEENKPDSARDNPRRRKAKASKYFPGRYNG